MNMQAIGKKISNLRKERDMTQVELADKLGVTYQAVSSWERGNSMPDIAKLPDISQVLAVSIDELLDNEKAAALVKNMLTGEVKIEQHIDMEALAEAAPILKPSQIEGLVGKSGISLEDIAHIAHHLNSDTLYDLIKSQLSGRGSSVDADALSDIACHMNSEDLKKVILDCFREGINGDVLAEIACHMNSCDLKEVALTCDLDGEALSEIACHMNSEDLVEIAAKFIKKHGVKAISDADIADHMNESDLFEAIMLAAKG